MTSRREFLKNAVFFGTSAIMAPLAFSRNASAASATPLNPSSIPQFVENLINPLDPSYIFQPDVTGGSNYTLQITEFQQNLGLYTSSGTPIPTTLWGYGTAAQSGTFPGRTFEVNRGQTIAVTYVNKLVDITGNPLPNRMPVDTTLDWANPGAVGGITPVPAVAHLHGGDSAYKSDGLPDAWNTPFDNGSYVGQTGRLFAKPYTYENNQESGTLWYHDHALGITRTNVYMGLAGFYFIRDNNENKLRANNVLPSFPYEVPLLIQDRMFLTDGSLYYPSTAPGLPNPTHLPEFFGEVALVNGKAWPKLDVEPRKYRFRFLNGSDSRVYDMRIEFFTVGNKVQPGKGEKLPLMVIGTELGLLDKPATPTLDTPVGGVRSGTKNVLPIAPGERYDVVVDFSSVPPGAKVLLTNTARAPYPDATLPSRNLMDRLMSFNVVLPLSATPKATVSLKTSLRPRNDLLPANNTTGVPVRRLMLFEGVDSLGRLQTMLGPVDRDPATGQQGTLVFKDPVSEHPVKGTTEIWEFYNTTVDGHPVHMHLVDFRILDRQTFTATITPKVNSDESLGGTIDPASIVKTGTAIPVNKWESGRKDTVLVFPGEVVRVLVSFRRAGEYVYHCHILSHEDHEMMRPYEVVP